jgi:hypothetical protein
LKKKENKDNDYDDDKKKLTARQANNGKSDYVSLPLFLCVIDGQKNRQKRVKKRHLKTRRDIYARFKAMNDED